MIGVPRMRIMGMVVSMPMLVLLTSTIGVMGGFMGGLWQDINMNAFYDRTINALLFVDLRDCMIKATVYGAVIGLVSVHRGMQVSGGASSIGRATTSSVVECIFMVILCAAILTTSLMQLP